MNTDAHDNHIERDEPEGFMRPCEECNGTGAQANAMGYLAPCPDCDGTGIHQDSEDTSNIQNPPDFLAENRQRIEKLEADLAAAQANYERALELLKLLHYMDYTQEALDYLMDEKDYANYAIVSNGVNWLNELQSPAPVQAAPVSPKFKVGDKVLNTDTSTPMTVRGVNGAEGDYWYLLNYSDGSKSAWAYDEKDLEAL